MYKNQTTINGNTVKFEVFGFGKAASITFDINGKKDRTLEGKSHPAICRWVIKEFIKICKWADKNQVVLYCTALAGDCDEELRHKAYHKYLGSKVDPETYARGVNGAELTEEDWYYLEPDSSDYDSYCDSYCIEDYEEIELVEV